MEKYIRTKDGTIYGNGGFILEIEKLNLNKIIGNIKYEIIDKKLVKTMYGYEAHIFEYDIVNQSDTIEELCDEFIVLGYYKNRPLHFDTLLEAQEFIWKNGCQDEDYIEIKGAVWTNKGLIYVAKMNEKGELELI